MDKQHAQTLLGLSEQFSATELANAIAAKKEMLQQKRDTAPTDALKAKFDQLLIQVAQAQALLQSTSPVSAQRPSSPLSQTKLADLPNMAGDTTLVQLQVGQILTGRYEVKEQIGAGGMGAVYCAFDRTRNKNIAIKVLLPALTSSERARERFLDEARLSSELSHPNIINVFDVQQDGDNWFITMELLEGQSLRSFITSHEATRTPIDIEETLEIVSKLCDALEHAHTKTVHRDIKPENIFLCEDGTIKLMDFGIARLMSNSQRTQTGAAMGTAYYMAPEQIKGRGDIDGRADQYALGVLLYEMLAGEVPTGRIESLHKIRKDVPASLARAVDTALAPKAEDRFANITEFKTALTKKGGASLPALPWKNIGLAAGVLIALLGVGGVLSSGSVDWASLLPKSKEEIATQKANVAKAQGEIKVYKQRLENGRRQLDSDVKDAARNKDSNLPALQHWQQLTENGIFAGSQITALEGELSMAETLLRENVFEQAQASIDKVSSGYKDLWDNFTAAEKLYSAEKSMEDARNAWANLAKNYRLKNPPEVSAAENEEQQANNQQLVGEFTKAQQHWQQATNQWQAVSAAVSGQVAAINKEREAKAMENAVAKAAAERKASQAKAEAARLAGEAEVAAKRQQQAALVQQGEGNLISIPAGSFQMGAKSLSTTEQPIHTVSIQAFKMQEHEVTFAQWDACVQAGGCSQGRGPHGTLPVNFVSYDDITQQFIPWLNEATGKRFRLPSEAEWEYAARGGTSTKYSWGDDYGSNRANCNDCGVAVTVKSFAPNAYGLYDMHGNVSEWVQDCWNDSYVGAPSNGSAWQGVDCRLRVLRGGNVANSPYTARSAYRSRSLASDSSHLVGFRLVQDN
ncbi:protein kinase domain-containing protein [Shewanella sp. HL-SH2]|uniref:bifunctional serine/threonine-protein kinase/formylglycine-generating enzyme family protein n=1 Tax=Shewanella sp. HL-SH2 TaxID=3436238 RepID=UPI003EB72EEA